MNTLYDLLEPLVTGAGYRLWWAQWFHGKTLQVFIDSDNGVGLGDCEKVSRELSAYLDVYDQKINAPGQYNLEVSSPGADRVLHCLEHYREYCGKKVRVKLHQAIENKRSWQGVLKDVNDNEMVLDIDGAQRTFLWQQVKESRLVFDPGNDFHRV